MSTVLAMSGFIFCFAVFLFYQFQKKQQCTCTVHDCTKLEVYSSVHNLHKLCFIEVFDQLQDQKINQHFQDSG